MTEPQPSDASFTDSDAETKASSLDAAKASGPAPADGDSSSGRTLGLEWVTLETTVPVTLPDTFGGYSLIRELHRGGQGVVYQAMQQSTRRKVAIKVMKEGPFAGPLDKARFEREVHILGQLNHPRIVAIHESGVVSGNHYFVMDYISGRSLDEHMRSGKHSTRATLELFAKICDAVNAAHLRGIIHRDLKPGNIRVDPDGEPHVLDFGLAKTLSGDAESAMITMTGQFMGSLPWASPEQAEAIPSKIDVRTDVYSLGVVLYQMLTGQLPYSVAGSVSDVLANIRNAAPARPSTIRKRINNEIETIVLKCLAKERERRYQSAGEVARDVRRYLNGEPIEAKRDSAWYVLTKTLRRHRGPAAIGLTFVVLLIGFATTMTFAYGRVAAEAEKAALVAGFLDDVLTSVDPEVARQGFDTPLHQALRETVDEAATRIDELGDRPEVQARVRESVGRVYMNLGLYAEAREQIRPAVESRRQVHGDQHAATARALHLLGWALKENAEQAESERAYTEALTIRQGLFGDDHLAVAETLNGLGQLHFAQGQHKAAEPLLREALRIRRRQHADERELATSLANLGSLLRDMRRLDEAEPLLREALDLRRQLFGDQHFHTVVSMNKLALLLRQKGAAPAARELFEEALQRRRALLGEHHPHVAVSLNNLALALLDEGRRAEASASFAAAVELWRDTLQPTDPRLARALVNHAACLRELGELEAAVTSCQEALAILPPDSRERASAALMLGRLRMDRGEAAAAESLLRELLTELEEDFPADHPSLAIAACELGRCLTAQGRFDEAEGLLLDAYEKLQAEYGGAGRETITAVRRLVALYTDWDQPVRAAQYRALLPTDDSALQDGAP